MRAAISATEVTTRRTVSALHGDFLRELVRLLRTGASATLFLVGRGATATSGAPTRLVSVSRGQIVTVDSNIPGERLGEFLVAQNRVDAALVDVLVAEARKAGRLLGEQLVADGLLSPTEVAELLEAQARERFARMLVMPAELRISENAPARAMLRWPIGATLVEAFRQRLPQEAITRTVTSLLEARLLVDSGDERLTSLQLLPAELRAVRRLATGEAPADLLRTAAPPAPLERLFCALAALELLH